MSSNPALWARIDLPLPEDEPTELINRPPYLVGDYYYSSKASVDDSGEPTMVLTKLTRNGAAVEAFGEHGTVRIRMPSESASWLCFVENGDHLVCSVALRRIEKFAIFRLNKTSGVLDLTFGDQGFKQVAYPIEEGVSPRQEGAEGYAGSVPQFADGKLRQAVNSGLAQFDLQGNLDTSFNNVGMRRFFTWEGRNLFTLEVVARYEGTEHAGFYYCGMHRVGGDDVQAWVGACDKHGAVVPGFAQQGVWIVKRLPGHPDIAHIAVRSAVQAHDRLYLVGDAGERGFVLRLKLDGSVDPSFNDGQAVIFNRPEFDRTKAFAVIAHDSGILVGCAHTYPLEDLPTAIVRLDANGKVDTSFADKGWLVTPNYPESKALLILAHSGQQVIELRGEKFVARYPL
ncbi:hypothetical protein [Pseudomonas sp. TE21394]